MFGKRSRPRAAEILEGLGGLDLLNAILKEIRKMSLDFTGLQAVVTGIQTDVSAMANAMGTILNMIKNVGAASETDQVQLNQVTSALQAVKTSLDATVAGINAALAPPVNPAAVSVSSGASSAVPTTTASGTAATASAGAVDTGSASASSAAAAAAGQPTAAASS